MAKAVADQAKAVEQAVAAAQGRVRAWIAVLDLIYNELLRSAAAIEPTPGEMDPEVDLDRLDEPTAVRAVLHNVAESHLRPAVDDLQTLLGEGEP